MPAASPPRDTKLMIGVAVAFAVLCGASLAFMPLDGFWVVDNAAKQMQVEALAASGGRDISLQLSAAQRSIDPAASWNPVPFPFAVTRAGKVYPVFAPAFALAAVPLQAVAGKAGLLVLPLLGGVFTLLGLVRLAAVVAPGDRHVAWLAPALAGLCTPMWFYSLEFWEHTPAVALLVWSLWFTLRFLEAGRPRDLVLGAMLAALGAWLRDDLLLLALVVVATPVVCRRGLRPALLAAVAVLACLLPLGLLQWKLVDSPLGLHGPSHLGASSSLGAHLAARPAVFYSMFLAAGPGKAVSIALCLPLVALLALGRRAPTSRPALLLLPVTVLALAAAFVFARGLAGPDGPIVHILRSSNAFLAAAPLVALGCVAPFRGNGARDKAQQDAGESAWRRLRLLAGAWALLYGLAAPLLGANGVHWGNRYLLALYPLLCLPAAIHLRQALRAGNGALAVSLKGALAVLVLASVGLQVWSLALLREKKQFTQRANERIEALQAPVVVTDVWWVPQELPKQFARSIFLVRSDQERDALDARLRATGHPQVLYVTRPGRPVTGRPLATIPDGNLRFYSLAIVQHPTGP